MNIFEYYLKEIQDQILINKKILKLDFEFLLSGDQKYSFNLII